MENLVMVFAKLPEPGRVKTRIAEDLGEERAVEIYRGLVGKVFARIPRAGFAVWVVFSPGGREREVRAWLADQTGDFADISFVPQCDGSLGERLENAFHRAFVNGGFQRVAAIGTDCPGVGGSHFDATWTALDGGADAVFGPAADGGYYLLGLRRVLPEVFRGIPWSSADTLKQSISGAETAGRSVALLKETLCDVDTVDDLLLSTTTSVSNSP